MARLRPFLRYLPDDSFRISIHRGTVSWPHPRGPSRYPELMAAPASFHTYTTDEVASYQSYALVFLPAARHHLMATPAGASSSSYSNRAPAGAASSSAPYSTPAAGWRLLPLAAVAALGVCIGGGIVAAAAGGGGCGREVVTPVDMYGREVITGVGPTKGLVLSDVSFRLPKASKGKTLAVSVWTTHSERLKVAQGKMVKYLKIGWDWTVNEIKQEIIGEVKSKLKTVILGYIRGALTVHLGWDLIGSGAKLSNVLEVLADHERRISALEEEQAKPNAEDGVVEEAPEDSTNVEFEGKPSAAPEGATGGKPKAEGKPSAAPEGATGGKPKAEGKPSAAPEGKQ